MNKGILSEVGNDVFPRGFTHSQISAGGQTLAQQSELACFSLASTPSKAVGPREDGDCDEVLVALGFTVLPWRPSARHSVAARPVIRALNVAERRGYIAVRRK